MNNVENKEYLGNRYSDKIFPNAKIKESDIKKLNTKDKLNKLANTDLFWTIFDKEIGYNNSRPVSIAEKNKEKESKYRQKYLINYIKASERLRRKRNFTNYTPDEQLIINKIRLQRKSLFYKLSVGTIIFNIIVSLFRRSYTSKTSILLTNIALLSASYSAAYYLTIRPSLVELDKLGSEFQNSRYVKQIIFNKRKDLTKEQKSEIYMTFQEKT